MFIKGSFFHLSLHILFSDTAVLWSHEYEFVPVPMSFTDAVDDCTAKGGDMVQMESTIECELFYVTLLYYVVVFYG